MAALDADLGEAGRAVGGAAGRVGGAWNQAPISSGSRRRVSNVAWRSTIPRL
jgi:hypothetical protein